MAEQYSPLVIAQSLAQERTTRLDQKIIDIEQEKARVVGIIEDYTQLFSNPIWPEMIHQARELPSGALFIGNPASRDVEHAHIVLAWGFNTQDIYEGAKAELFRTRGEKRRKSTTWMEVWMHLQTQPGTDFKYLEINGTSVLGSDIDPKLVVEEALKHANFRGGWGDRELRRGENIKTNSSLVRLKLDELPH